MRTIFALSIAASLLAPLVVAAPASAQETRYAGEPDWTVTYQDRMHASKDSFYQAPLDLKYVKLVPYVSTYQMNSFLRDIREARRFGGKVSVPVGSFVLEGEGSRDVAPLVSKLDIGRLRLSQEYEDGWSAGAEFILERGRPSNLLGAPHVDRGRVFAFHIGKTFGSTK